MGVASRGGGPQLFYTIEAPPYPQTTTLSVNRTDGSTQGDVQLVPEGLKICQAGTYAVSFNAIVANNMLDDIVLSVFLVQNGVFDPDNHLLVGTTAQLPGFISSFGTVTPLSTSGIIQNIPCGTTLSLVAANGVGDTLDEISILAWGITAYRINGCP